MRHYRVQILMRGADVLSDPRTACAQLAHALAPFSAVIESGPSSLQARLHIVSATAGTAEERAKAVLRAAADLLVPEIEGWRMRTMKVQRG